MTRTKITCNAGPVVKGSLDWIPQPGYPKITQTDDAISVDMQYVSDKQGLGHMPTLRTPFSHDGIEDVIPMISYCRLKEAVIEPYQGSPDVYVVKLSYQTDEDYAETTADPVALEVTLSTQDSDVPLEQHESYLAKWDHELWGWPSGAPNPASYDSAKIPIWDKLPKEEPESTSTSKFYRMAKPGSKPDCEWLVKLKPETKPGVQSYRDGIHTVTEVRRSRSLQKAIKPISGEYSCQTPSKTFGISGGQWLQGGSSITKNGDYWEVSTEYLYAPKKWDKDIYTGGTGDPNA